jgi:hypothetical protein
MAVLLPGGLNSAIHFMLKRHEPCDQDQRGTEGQERSRIDVSNILALRLAFLFPLMVLTEGGMVPLGCPLSNGPRAFPGLLCDRLNDSAACLPLATHADPTLSACRRGSSYPKTHLQATRLRYRRLFLSPE